MGKPEFTGCDLIQWEWEIMGKPEFMGCDLLQQEIMGKPESTGCDLIQWEIMGKYIYQLGATVKITKSNIIIKISHPEQWESDSAQENHTLLQHNIKNW